MYTYKEMQEVKEHWKSEVMWWQLVAILALFVGFLIGLTTI